MNTRTHTFQNIVYHIIFSTKKRANAISPEIMKKLRYLFEEKADSLGCTLHIANGCADHVHLLISIPPKWSVSCIVKYLKGYSSNKIPDLYWQRGFAVFTADRESFDRIYRYIKNQ